MFRLFIVCLMAGALVVGIPGCAKKESGEAGKMQSETTTTTPPTTSTQVQGNTVSFGKFTATLPEGWTAVQPSSSMRVAQFSLNAAQGDPEPGELTVFYFGPDAGDIEANITRWQEQFEQPDGRNTSDITVRQSFEYNGLQMTSVMFTGTMKASQMPGAPETPRCEGWMNHSAIVMTPEGPWFFKGTGPENTMKIHHPEMLTFLSTLTYAGEV